jgi:predicted RNase H-like nuclease (RuvC/YqgF family)
MYFVSICQEMENEKINNVQSQKAVENHSGVQNDIVSREKFANQTNLSNNSFRNNDLTKSLETFVEIIPQVILDNTVEKKNEEIKALKLELENQKKLIENLNKENSELKLNSNEKDKDKDKDKEINEYKETIANLKKKY